MTHGTSSHFSVTCQTDDEAVYYCLVALRRWAEGDPPDAPAGTAEMDGWRANAGELTLRFSSARARGAFLGEATRLLSGKWLRLGTADDVAG